MYIEFESKANQVRVNTLALDWDETTSDYPLSFRELSKRFDRVIIVTVNDELTIDYVRKHLDRPAENPLRYFAARVMIWKMWASGRPRYAQSKTWH